MNKTVRKCVVWAGGLFLLGAIAIVWLPSLYAAIADHSGPTAQAGLNVLDVLLTLIRSSLFPIGAALVGAAVVIQALDGSREP